MATRDPRIDRYIDSSPAFAQPILSSLRAAVHAGCPSVEETMKWGRPHFMHRGLLCGMSAFKAHCAFGFWKGSLLVPNGARSGRDGMGQFGRITRVADLPARRAIVALVRAAAVLNEKGVPSPTRAKPVRRAPPRAPDYLKAALAGNAKARDFYATLSPSGKREYIEWLGEAKRSETRAERLKTTIEWLAQGKSRNWKYERPSRAQA